MSIDKEPLKIMKSRIILLLLGCAFSGWSQQLSLRASVDRTELSVNDQLVVTVELQGEGANTGIQPELPDVSEFLSFLGSGGTSQSVQIINGHMSVQKSITYFYQAIKEGSLTFPPIKATFNSRAFESQPISLVITKAASQPAATPSTRSTQQPQVQAAGEGDDQLFIRAVISKRQVYQNEPVLVTYRIYTLVQVSGMGQPKMAPSPGFWVEDFDIGNTLKQHEEVYNGRKYVVADIKKSAYFPTSPGKKTIQSMVIPFDVRATARRRGNDIFDSFFDDPFFSRVVRKEVATRPVDIEVLPFPDEGKPADFTGLVGQFNMDVSVDKQSVKTNEAITLKVRYTGQGNVRTLPKPEIVLPADFEKYEPKVNENVNRQGDVISGSKSYEYVLIPRFPGQQRIPSVRLSYFDPQNRRYKTVTCPEILISVQKGDGKFFAAPAGLSKEEVRLIGQDIRFIKTNRPEFRRIGSAFYQSGTFILLCLLPLLGLVVALGYKRHLQKLSGDIAYARSRSANRMAMKRLARADKVLSEETQKEFYAEISRALIGFAADKLNLSEAGMIQSELQNRLQLKSVDLELVQSYLNLLQACDFQRFAPAAVRKEEMSQFFLQAKEAIIKLEKAF
jgi:hypothetical protein